MTGVAAAKKALGVPVYLHRDDLFLYDHAVESGAMFGLRGRAAAADRRVLHAGPGHPFREVRSPSAPHAGALSRRRLPADRTAGRDGPGPVRRRHALRRDRSAGLTCRAAITRRSSPRSGRCCSALETRPSSIPAMAPTRPSAASAAPTRFSSGRTEVLRYVRGGRTEVLRDMRGCRAGL